ncbi:nucleoside diphosphate kinase, putative [Aduncisulcus paluster]|uniref:Nucleoside diphosphate kinase, putative n=1 Tax=Aduncisulcus paluster TaxID=2918883 RepID=A0ABQ5KBS5_9EUKA|nr:nucleoside diphosphate kinase, putative [Aduncisulcus paluster]
MAEYRKRYAFNCEYYDVAADLIRPYTLFYYLSDGTIEMFDERTKRCFLKRTTFPLDLDALDIDRHVKIFGRQLKIVSYGDAFTKTAFDSVERTYAMIKPGTFEHVPSIISRIEESGLVIHRLKSARMSEEIAGRLYKEHDGKSFYPNLMKMITSEPMCVMELRGEGCVKRWRDLMGPTNPETAKRENPRSLRALYAKNITYNAVHGSDSSSSAERELGIVFGDDGKCPLRSTASATPFCTCVVILPHAVKEKKVGSILQHLDKSLPSNAFISAVQMFTLTPEQTKEFYAVYEGATPEYSAMVRHLSSDSCVAVCISSESEEIVGKMREWAGPKDSVIAKAIRKESARALFGYDSVQNAVHVSDLVEEAPVECGYFFKLLQ